MKKANYNDKSVISFFITIFIILTMEFFYILNNKEIWTFYSYTLIKKEDKIYELVLTKKEYEKLKVSKHFYYKSKKYIYTMENKEEINNLEVLTVKLKKEISKEKSIKVIVPKTKQRIIKIIIESWRSN